MLPAVSCRCLPTPCGGSGFYDSKKLTLTRWTLKGLPDCQLLRLVGLPEHTFSPQSADVPRAKVLLALRIKLVARGQNPAASRNYHCNFHLSSICGTVLALPSTR